MASVVWLLFLLLLSFFVDLLGACSRPRGCCFYSSVLLLVLLACSSSIMPATCLPGHLSAAVQMTPRWRCAATCHALATCLCLWRCCRSQRSWTGMSR